MRVTKLTLYATTLSKTTQVQTVNLHLSRLLAVLSHNPISSFEVEQAAKKLRNGKAVGPDGIPNEFLKHSPPIFYSTFAQLTNQSFERHEHVPSFTEGFLTPLQKPGKPRGPLKSLRPLCLLNGTRKILSLDAFKDKFLSTQNLAKCTQAWP